VSANPIPTLSTWALLALAITLSAVALRTRA
ncbi:MAG: IPTL-CTERM sorting domain-containing protein, partial [Acidobacteria bacterium]|nr:IPTL-CTERM sorting domain-containing protein [Acidobacteriota bacterium]